MKRRIFSLLFFFLLTPSVFALDDSIEELERQKSFLAHFDKKMEGDKLKQEAERQAEENRRHARTKNTQQTQIEKQFAGLSQKLSQMPTLPAFSGKLEEPAANRKTKVED